MNLKKKFILIKKKNLFSFLKNGSIGRKSGVNFSGKKTCRNRGFINKKKLRNIDYFRAYWHIKYFVMFFEVDPNRKTLLSLVQYSNQAFSYIISIDGLKFNKILINGNFAPLKIGVNTILKNVRKGLKVSNIETFLCSGAKLLRSSSSKAKLLSKNKNYCSVLFKSKKSKKLSVFCTSVLGGVFNFDFNLKKYKKASYYRYKGFKSKVRGVAMNPVDHPHGGGEGKKSKKKNPTSPWGKKLNFVKR